MNNITFIDGQNLHLGTTKCSDCCDRLTISFKEMKFSDCNCGNAWKIDFSKFRVYLKEKYSITEAYYFLGYLDEENNDLYKKLQKAGFIVEFRDHSKLAKSSKKGNVDTDIVFEIMKNMIDNKEFDKITLVSGDGDYQRLVKYLIEKEKFQKILFPNRKFASSLYKKLGSEYFDYLDNVRNKVGVNKKGS